MSHPKSFLAAGALLLTALANPARASIVLMIDVTNPAAVTFTSTAALSQTNSSLNIGLDGFTIENVFTSPVNILSSATASGNLAPTGSAFVYAGLGTFEFNDNDGVFKTANDLSIYSAGAPGSNSQIFSTLSRAFNGVMTANFSSYAAQLPTPGTTGQVYSGYFKTGTADHGLTVGQFIVVPEPSSIMVLGLGLMTLSLNRRRNA